jgi:hypothetical protein
MKQILSDIKMSSFYSTNLERLKSYSFYKRSQLHGRAARSLNPNFPMISKQDDITRYNSANYNVYYYKDYPNRASTPISRKCSKSPKSYNKSISPNKKFVNDLIENSCLISQNAKKNIMQKALSAQLRHHKAAPKLIVVDSGSKGFVMNDFHKRESNPGYARNSSGGFFTR